MFVSYRRVDTGWAANAVADALRRHLGTTEVFLDNQSIGLGKAFDRVLRDGVRQAAVLVAPIGPNRARPRASTASVGPTMSTAAARMRPRGIRKLLPRSRFSLLVL